MARATLDADVKRAAHVNVRVTLRGLAGDRRVCPIALAIREAYPERTHLTVDKDHICYTVDDVRYVHGTPPGVAKFIQKLDGASADDLKRLRPFDLVLSAEKTLIGTRPLSEARQKQRLRYAAKKVANPPADAVVVGPFTNGKPSATAKVVAGRRRSYHSRARARRIPERV